MAKFESYQIATMAIARWRAYSVGKLARACFGGFFQMRFEIVE
jgi:hypothetical protein